MFKRLKIVVTLVTALCIGISTASAGEITGNGKRVHPEDQPLPGNSECAYSGQNDSYSGDPNVPDADGFTRVQNWGHISKAAKAFLTSIGLSPGDACNGNKNPQH